MATSSLPTGLLLALGASLIPLADAFVVTPSLRAIRSEVVRHAFLPSSTTMLAVEFFDGSQVVDPVVVSGVFWSSLQAKFLSLIIGQILATFAFGLLTTVAASQVSKLGDWVTTNVGAAVESSQKGKNQVGDDKTRSAFKKAGQESTYTPIDVDLSKLALCVLIDVVGSSSELLPIVGEVTDVVWAPIAALLTRNLFYGSNVVLILEFAEEILPFTDILPLATLCWVLDTYFGESEAARALGLGSYSNKARVDLNDDRVIDVEARSRPLQNSLTGDKKER